MSPRPYPGPRPPAYPRPHPNPLPQHTLDLTQTHYPQHPLNLTHAHIPQASHTLNFIPSQTPVVNCDLVGVHTPGRAPDAPNRVNIDITFAISETLWTLSTWDGQDDSGGVWGDRFVTHTVLPSGQLCVRATNWRVTEAPIKVVKAHLESRAGKTLPSGDGARFKVDEAKCTIERFE
ncbi:hypothetical protein BDV98DRAFT_601998 [Pterulicium gracile]|uniref:Uncharacterized protein n=1 Tax=Pterulicium gracile TaxID=1884261 RepID=A0A5C3QRH2_9AGAR|nr:hypothetical protein BDV98DRAFT_601998 [Pterula gracilis]